MAEQAFGIKEFNLIGSGTPTISSPNNLNLKAATVAISTNISIGGTMSVIGGGTFGIGSTVGIGSTLYVSHGDLYLRDNHQLNINNDALTMRGNNGGNSFITNFIDQSDGSPGNFYISNYTGDIEIGTSEHFSVKTNALGGAEQAILATQNGSVALYHDGGNKKIETLSIGATVTGTLFATSFSGIGSNITGISTSNIVDYGIGLGGGGGSGISNVVDDTSPQLGGNLDVQSREINTSATNGNIKLTPNGTGCIEVKGAGGNDGTIQLNCSVNSHGVKIKSPPHSAAATYTLTLPTNIVNGQFLKTDGSGNLSWAASGTASRTTTSASTGSIAQGSSANITISTPGKTISLLKVAIDAPAYVILYTDSTSRSNDASRSEGTDPTPGSGVLTEVSTTTSGASTFLMTPAVLGWNNDSTPASQIYAKVVNKRATSGSNTITVTLTSVALES